ncbi:MAG: hypothetical protein LBF77_08425 [Spirochaetaceae bacterium]|jgi:hypothetical protein|nr:hypothetical protein [Spirochaetaceae bacterium]
MAEQDMRDSLIEDVKSELKKDAEDIDPDFIDRRIGELYTLDGLDPPKLSGEALDAAARTIRARAAWKRRNTLAKEARKRRFTRGVVRGAAAACCLAFFTFSANYITTLVTGSCIPSKVGIKICCGTQFCRCDPAKMEKTDHLN